MTSFCDGVDALKDLTDTKLLNIVSGAVHNN